MVTRASAAIPRGRPPGTQGHLSQLPRQIHAKAPRVGQKIGTKTPPLEQPGQHISNFLKKKNPVYLQRRNKRITPAQEKWENSHFKENIRFKTGMTNDLFQRNQQNKTEGIYKFEALISLTKYEKNETRQASKIILKDLLMII